MRFAGIVVTYNRKEELIKNIRSVLEQNVQLDMYYIIDNCSTDGTRHYLEEQGILPSPKIKYISLEENLGGAGGFYNGVKVAYQDGYDFVCLMDDDGRPSNKETFHYLFEAALELYKKNKLLMINSLVVCDEKADRLSFGLKKMTTRNEIEKECVDSIFYNHINPFNGTLISRELIECIGYPNKDFFIRGDEVDFQSRAKKGGAIIATVTNSIYYHPTFELLPLRWKGEIVYVGICPPWKGYYLVRNYTYRLKRDEGLLQAIKEFIFQLYITRKCNPDYKACMKLLFKGFFDGITGKLGKRVEPGQK